MNFLLKCVKGHIDTMETPIACYCRKKEKSKKWNKVTLDNLKQYLYIDT
jgi:hypothetical protein